MKLTNADYYNDSHAPLQVDWDTADLVPAGFSQLEAEFNRQFELFCRRRGMKCHGMRELISADFSSAVARKKAAEGAKEKPSLQRTGLAVNETTNTKKKARKEA